LQPRSRSYLLLGIVLLLAALAGILYARTKYQLGLDIRGGVRLTYQMDLSKLPKNPAPNLEDIRQRTGQILSRRAGTNLGVVEALIQPKGTDQFIVELPGFTNIDEALKVMGTSAQIEFFDASNVQTKTASYREYTEKQSDDPDNPEVWFVNRAGETIKPGTPQYAEIIKGWGDPIVKGDELKSAEMEQLPGGGYQPLMNFTKDGPRKMSEWSHANNHRGEMLAAVLDNVCISIAPLKDGAVLSDNAIIEGNFSAAYVRSLRDLMNSGALPVHLKVLSSERVDPSIGQNALDKMVTAGVVAAAVISAFMLLYYVFPGFIAVLALALYILFTLTALKLINATFSLAAIAGFVLSVGMAVDANILVFERLKEELRAGKSLHDAIQLGFKRALTAIIDSNACTILTALVLLNLGTGPVKGFATTLIIGVAISFFTAVVVTRSLLVFFVDSGIGEHPTWYGINHQWFGRFEKDANTKPLQVVNKAGRYFLISGLTIVPGVIFWLMGGLKGNVEFTGGIEATYAIPQTVSPNAIGASLGRNGFPGAMVTIGDNGKERLAYITIPPNKQINESNPTAAREAIANAAGLNPLPDRGISGVGGTVSSETLYNAIEGIVLSSVLIILYLALRFGFALGGFKIGLRFSVSTILALLHDILVVIGLAAITGYLLNWQVSALFISAMLTVIGFSTHDTIVIFDRIRENLRRPREGEDIGNLINRSITQSLARSINTSMTVIFTLALLIAVGSATPELKLFNAAMLVGIISGTYSSIYNASPILYLWDLAIGKKNPNETLLGIVRASRVKVKLRAPVQEPGPAARPAAATAAAPAPAAGQPSYGQVRRRRASEVERSKRSIDDED